VAGFAAEARFVELSNIVVAGLDPAIHDFSLAQSKTWLPRVKPGHDEKKK
jgi:hypothetical protein